jgi:hypothetical protein
MVHVASSRGSRGIEAQDGRVDAGCIGHFYLNFVIFIVLDYTDILVF